MNPKKDTCCDNCLSGNCFGVYCPCHTSPEKEIEHVQDSPKNWIDETLDLFREKFVRDDGLMDKYYTYGMDIGCHQAFMADAIEEFFEDKLEESAENERFHILTLIESKTKGPHNECRESFAEIWNAALTSLAAELQDI